MSESDLIVAAAVAGAFVVVIIAFAYWWFDSIGRLERRIAKYKLKLEACPSQAVVAVPVRPKWIWAGSHILFPVDDTPRGIGERASNVPPKLRAAYNKMELFAALKAARWWIKALKRAAAVAAGDTNYRAAVKVPKGTAAEASVPVPEPPPPPAKPAAPAAKASQPGAAPVSAGTPPAAPAKKPPSPPAAKVLPSVAPKGVKVVPSTPPSAPPAQQPAGKSVANVPPALPKRKEE